MAAESMASASAPTAVNVATSSTNIAGGALVTASAENRQTGQLATKAVDGVVAGYPGDYTKEWEAPGGKAGSWLLLKWAAAATIDKVVLYDRPNTVDQATAGTLTFSDGTSVPVPSLTNTGLARTVTFTARATTSVRFTINSVSASTVNVGLSEFQVWTSVKSTPPTSTPPTTSAPVTPTAPNNSSAMPAGDLSGWKQIFADDFTVDAPLGTFPGSSYSNRWFPYSPGCCDTSGYGTYDASKVVSVSGGVMDAYLHTEGGKHYVNAMVAKAPSTGWGQLYGRYSIRMKADAMSGYKVVPLLWPDSDIWDQGEIDFPEVNLLTAGEKTKANVYLAGRWQNFESNVDMVGGWHIYTTDWKPGRLTFYIDGTAIWSTTKDVPTMPMHYVVQFESAIGAGAPPDSMAGHVQVDWTTMYAPAP
jgi:hypothetical protein